MIEVIIRIKGGKQLGRITLENVTEGDGNEADYSIRYSVDKIGAVGMHQRAVYKFPLKRYNVLALLLQALNTLEPDELKLEGDIDDKPLGLGWDQLL